MIKLIGLNLLPYREIAQQKKQEEFNRLMVLSLLVGVILAGAVWLFLGQTINNQESRNQLLKDNIAKLDEEIKEVENLEQKKKDFLARKQKIEELQNERYVAAMMLNDLNTLLPDGAYLTKIESKESKEKGGIVTYELVGNALSDSKVATFMRSLPSTGVFQTPSLNLITTKGSAQEFKLNVKLVKHVDSEGK